MKTNILKNLFLIILCATFLSCVDSTSEKMSEQDREDFNTMINNAPQGQPVELDFSNPVHYRFYVKQLHLAGITPDKYPQQFKVLEETKRKHEQEGFKKVERPLLSEINTDVGISGLITPIQTITSMGTSDGTNFASSALSSIANQPYLSQLTLGLYDQNNNPIGTPKFAQQHNSGTDLQVNATGALTSTATDVDSGTGSIATSLATYFWQGQHGDAHHGYVRASTSSNLNTAPKAIINTDPMPKSGQPVIKLCLGRTGSDCSYIPSGGSGSNVLMPITGSITFDSNIDQSPTTPNSSLITIARPDATEGGGTTIATTDNFFNPSFTQIVGPTITWRLNPAHFQPANGILKPNSKDIYTFTIGLTVANLPVYVTITNDPGAPTNDFYKKIPDLYVYFSCLAEGSQIKLANGDLKLIEEIVHGDELITDLKGNSLAVDSKLKGKEEVPMARLRTANGYDLLLTDGHPVVTPDGIALARMLDVGDKVITSDGASTLIAVGREQYDGFVWNLNVGPPQEDFSNLSDETTFFANGILVGDNQMQFNHNRKQKFKPFSILKALPVEWHQDYYNYVSMLKLNSEYKTNK